MSILLQSYTCKSCIDLSKQGRGANVAQVIIFYKVILRYQYVDSLVKVDWYYIGEVLFAQLH